MSNRIIKRLMEMNPGTKEEDYLVRADGRVEWRCSHGIGHTVYASPFSDFIHGCDRCCKNIKVIK
jgi:hypothetical protein